MVSVGGWIGIGIACLFVLSMITWYIIWRIIEKSHTFNAYSTASQSINNMNLKGKVAIITGSNSGIGKESAKIMLRQGCTIIMACRSTNKGETAIEDIINELGHEPSTDDEKARLETKNQNNEPVLRKDDLKNRLILMKLDLSSLQSVYDFAMEIKQLMNNNNEQSSLNKIDYLLNNAGIMALPQYRESTDGFEMQFATNHLGHWYLTELLLPLLKQYHTRIICLTSIAQMFAKPHPRILELFNQCIAQKDFMGDKRGEYDDYYVYGVSKLCNLLYARSLYNKYWKSDGIMAVGVHPGTITGTHLIETVNPSSNLKFWRKLINPQYYWEEMKNIPQGAATSMRCVSMTDDEIKGGHMYLNCRSLDDRNGLYKTAKEDKNKYNNALMDKMNELSQLLVESKGFRMTLE